MKALHDFAKTLTDALAAIEGAKAAEERAKSSQQAMARALENVEKARIAADKIKADADTYVRDCQFKGAAINQETGAKLAAEKSQHERWIENAKGQVDAASQTLTALQKEIADARAKRDALNAEIARVGAAFSDAAAKLKHG